MPGYSEQLSQAIALMDYIYPTNAAVASYNSAKGIDLSEFKRALFIVQVGVVNTSATLDGRLQGSANSNFSGAANIANTNLTQITASNVHAKIEIRADQLINVNSSWRYVRLNTTVGTSQVNYGAIGVGSQGIQGPASQYEITATVGQTVITTP